MTAARLVGAVDARDEGVVTVVVRHWPDRGGILGDQGVPSKLGGVAVANAPNLVVSAGGSASQVLGLSKSLLGGT